MSLSRAELQSMDRDELIEAIVGLSQTVDDLRVELDSVRQDRIDATDEAAKDRADIRRERADVIDELRSELQKEREQRKEAEQRLHRERSKLARRLSAIEDEVGITTSDALAVAEGGEEATHLSKLGRLIRHGPEAITDDPTTTMRRAKELVDNWERWGEVRRLDPSTKERRLASKRDDLKTHLEDERGERLSWKQVYRAMELIADWSDGMVALKEGDDGEGKYVLVHRMEVGE